MSRTFLRPVRQATLAQQSRDALAARALIAFASSLLPRIVAAPRNTQHPAQHRKVIGLRPVDESEFYRPSPAKKAAARSTGRRNTIPPDNCMKVTVLHDDCRTKSLCRRTSRALAQVEGRRVGERHRASVGADARYCTRHAFRLRLEFIREVPTPPLLREHSSMHCRLSLDVLETEAISCIYRW